MDVFVYGTLTSPERVREVLDSFVFVGPAVLRGLHAVSGQYPTLAPGGEVGGRVLRIDGDAALATLDAYEGVDQGLYVRESVPCRGEGVAAEVAVYVGDPAALDAPVEWPDDGPFARRVGRYLETHEVVVEVGDAGPGLGTL